MADWLEKGLADFDAEQKKPGAKTDWLDAGLAKFDAEKNVEPVATGESPDDFLEKFGAGDYKAPGLSQSPSPYSPETQASIEQTLAPLRKREGESQPSFLGMPIGYSKAKLVEGEPGGVETAAGFDKARHQTDPDASELAAKGVQFVGDFFTNAAMLPYSTAKLISSAAQTGYIPPGMMEDPVGPPSKEAIEKTVAAAQALGRNIEGGGLILPAGLARAALGKAATPLLQKALTYGPIAAMTRPMVDLGTKLSQDPMQAWRDDPAAVTLMALGGYKSAKSAGNILGGWAKEATTPKIETKFANEKRMEGGAFSDRPQRPVETEVLDQIARQEQMTDLAKQEIASRQRLPQMQEVTDYLPRYAKAAARMMGAVLPKYVGATEAPSGVIRKPGAPDEIVAPTYAMPGEMIADVVLGRSPGHAKPPTRLVGDVGDTPFRDLVQPETPEVVAPTVYDRFKSKLPPTLVESWETPSETQARLQRKAGVSSADMPTEISPELARLHEIQSRVTATPETAQSVMDVLRTFDPELQSLQSESPVSARASRLIADPIKRGEVGLSMLGEQVGPVEVGKTKYGVRSGVPFESRVYKKSPVDYDTLRQEPMISWLDEARGRNAAGVETPMPLEPSAGPKTVGLKWPEYDRLATEARDAATKAEETFKTYYEKAQRELSPLGKRDILEGDPDVAALKQQVTEARKQATIAENIAAKFKEAEATGATALAKDYIETVMPIASRVLGRVLAGNERGAVDILFKRILEPEQAQGRGPGARFSKTQKAESPETGVTKLEKAEAPATVKTAQAGLHATISDLIHDLSFAENLKAVFDSMPDKATYKGPLRAISFQALKGDSGTNTIAREMARSSQSGWFPKDWATRAAVEKTLIPEAHATLIEYLAGMPRKVRLQAQKLQDAASEGAQSFEKLIQEKPKVVKTAEDLSGYAYKLLRNTVVAFNWPTRVWNAVSNFSFGEQLSAKYGTPSPMIHPVQWMAEVGKVSRDIYRGNLNRKIGYDSIARRDVTLRDVLTGLGEDPTKGAQVEGFVKVAGIPVLPTIKGMTVDAIKEWKRAAQATSKVAEGAVRGARKSGAPGMVRGMYAGAEAALRQMWKAYSEVPETTYEMGMFSDLVHRVPAMKFLLEKGWEFNDAIRIVKDGYLNYANSNGFTQAMSKWFVPFAAFSAKATPKVIEYLVTNPTRALFWSLAGRSGNLGGALAEGMTPEEWQQQRDERGTRHATALVTGPDTEMNLARGSPKSWFFDVGLDTIDQMQRGNTFGASLKHALSRSSGIPLFEAISQWETGKDPQTGQMALDAVELLGNIGLKYTIPPHAKAVMEVLRREGGRAGLDALSPGIFNPDLRDRQGNNVTVGQDVMQALVGNRERVVNIPKESKKAREAMEREQNKAKTVLKSRMRDAMLRNDFDALLDLDNQLQQLGGTQ